MEMSPSFWVWLIHSSATKKGDGRGGREIGKDGAKWRTEACVGGVEQKSRVNSSWTWTQTLFINITADLQLSCFPNVFLEVEKNTKKGNMEFHHSDVCHQHPEFHIRIIGATSPEAQQYILSRSGVTEWYYCTLKKMWIRYIAFHCKICNLSTSVSSNKI